MSTHKPSNSCSFSSTQKATIIRQKNISIDENELTASPPSEKSKRFKLIKKVTKLDMFTNEKPSPLPVSLFEPSIAIIAPSTRDIHQSTNYDSMLILLL